MESDDYWRHNTDVKDTCAIRQCIAVRPTLTKQLYIYIYLYIYVLCMWFIYGHMWQHNVLTCVSMLISIILISGRNYADLGEMTNIWNLSPSVQVHNASHVFTIPTVMAITIASFSSAVWQWYTHCDARSNYTAGSTSFPWQTPRRRSAPLVRSTQHLKLH